jgi:AhpD family alkylhydroperoxidase
MPPRGLLSPKDKELIAIGASIGAGCQSCTAHHIEAAREAHATNEEIREAIDQALVVRRRATRIMLGVAERLLGNEDAVESHEGRALPPVGELVSIAASVGLNCTSNLEMHLRAARKAGATTRQARVALSVARAVRKVAMGKADAVAKALTKPAETPSSVVQ